MNKVWFYAKDVARLLEIDVNAVPRVMAEAGVRRREIPGTHRRYHADDVLKFAGSIIKTGPLAPAEAEAVAS